MGQSAIDTPLAEVYTFVIECALNPPSSGPEAYGRSTTLDVMQKFHDPRHPERTQNLSPNLAKWLDRRKVFIKLRRATDLQVAINHTDFVIKLFATGLAWFLINVGIKSETTNHEDWRRYLSSLMRDKGLWDPSELGISRLKVWRSTLAKWYK
ncbi:hypothetical protein RSAG8_10161, partial [Rhizoctonia solani AG-8 WAC10335]